MVRRKWDARTSSLDLSRALYFFSFVLFCLSFYFPFHFRLAFRRGQNICAARKLQFPRHCLVYCLSGPSASDCPWEHLTLVLTAQTSDSRLPFPPGVKARKPEWSWWVTEPIYYLCSSDFYSAFIYRILINLRKEKTKEKKTRVY